MSNALDLFVIDKPGTPEERLKPKLDKGFVALFVGRSGSGKDCAQWSFPGPSYTYDIDNRIRGGLASLQWLTKERISKVDFDYYNTRDGFKGLDDKMSLQLIEASQRQLKYKSIFINSVSSLSSMLARDSQRLRGALPESQGGFKGKVRGKLAFLHPDDYNYVSTAFRTIIFDFVMPMAELGINIIFSSWVINQYGKKPGTSDYSPAEVIGERLAGTSANLAEEIPGYFDEVYRFFREDSGIVGNGPKYMVEFNGGFAKTALNLPFGKFDITGKSFYELLKEKIETPEKKKETKK
jgi:hypothetical protein